MSVYSDLNLTCKKHPGTKDILKKIDVEAVKSSLRNIIMGAPFDIPFDPYFGSAIRTLLFELQSSSLQATVKRNIILKLNEYDTRVVIENIAVATYENTLGIELKFHVTGVAEIQQLNLILEKVR